MDFQRNDDATTDPCFGCIEAVQDAIDFASDGGEEAFDRVFGDLIDDLHDAIWALHRVRRERYTSRHDEIANSWEAARKLVLIKNAVENLIERGGSVEA